MSMNSLRVVACVATLLAVSCGGDDDRASRGDALPAPAIVAPTVAPWLTEARRAEEDTIFGEAARAAWHFANRNYIAGTGLTRPLETYPIGTMWDLASGLAATFSAAELGLLPRAEFDQRMARALRTLEQIPLFENVAFNKEYVFTTGSLITLQRQPGRTGYGISAIDQGRLLLWLRIIANRYPVHAAAAGRVVKRLDLAELVDDGYLQGRQISRRTGKTRAYQEGRIGYEQYAARGLHAWGADAEKALDIGRSMGTREVYGVVLPQDKRGGDRLTSEPFMLLGLEAGFTPAEQDAARRVLDVQAVRYAKGDTLTMASEDAINIAPDYFFYYAILSPRGPFTIEVQRGVRVTGPRWVSTKAAFAWHALMPGDYTRRVVDHVRARARVGEEWGSGVLESGRPTGHPNLNTAAVVLEAAAYRKLGRPFISLPALPASPSDPAAAPRADTSSRPAGARTVTPDAPAVTAPVGAARPPGRFDSVRVQPRR
jgi:Protein of unknown function (DUF3131)